MLIDNARPIFSGRAPSLLPTYFNAVLGTLWAYCIIFAMGLSVLHAMHIHIFPGMPTLSLFPEWSGPTLCTVYLLQAGLSTWLEKRFEPQGQTSLFWMIWYPIAFWMMGAATAAVALPRAVFRPRAGRTTWVSPDRGLR